MLDAHETTVHVAVGHVIVHITRALEQTEEFQPVSTTPCRVIIGLTNYSVGLLPRLTNVPRQICTAINAKR